MIATLKIEPNATKRTEPMFGHASSRPGAADELVAEDLRPAARNRVTDLRKLGRAARGGLGALVASLLVLLLGAPARAEDRPASFPQLELGVTGGAHLFAHDLELGVADDPRLPSPKDSGLFGLRAALAFNPVLSLEAEGVGIPTGDRKNDFRIFVVGWRAHLLVHVLPGHRWRPFVLAGAGALSVADSVSTRYQDIKTDTDFVFHGGAGVKYALTPAIGLRADARVLGVPNTTPKGFSPDFELMGGIYFTLGGHRAPKDSDGDGIADAADRCPTAAEDKDGFEDGDGCPDPDNDQDGIADAVDKCPNEAETKNGIDDQDGCPEKDEDGDGIVGSADKCPTAAEDKDGFEDEDGCPDPDNDQDGIADAADKCPNEAESMNGFEDEDGCPDVAPPAPVALDAAVAARFEGVIKGISFAKASAEITPSSRPALEEAVAILTKYPTLRIEIGGHSSVEGKAEFNHKLSERRASAARDYLVDRGRIAPARITAVGYGADRPIADSQVKVAREKSRRIEIRVLPEADQPSAPARP
jgi:outer membrane protein OmpA-like peptidoglycan-associated protein